VPAPEAWDLASVDDFERRTAAVAPEQMDDVVLICSDPGELVQRLRELADIGFDRLFLHQVGADQDAFLAIAGEHVLPALR
jgi:hypothetical protein